LDVVREEKSGDANGLWIVWQGTFSSYALENKYWKHLNTKSSLKICVMTAILKEDVDRFKVYVMIINNLAIKY